MFQLDFFLTLSNSLSQHYKVNISSLLMIEIPSMKALGIENAKNALNQNVIKLTRTIVSKMTEIQRFEKAKAHVMDALRYKHPRFQSESLQTPLIYRLLYQFESSTLWGWILFLFGYSFLYLVILDSKQYTAKIALESIILSCFWIDTLILRYFKNFDNFKKVHHYSGFYIFKFIIISLMTIDLIIFICLPCQGSRPIRPFRILRCFVPLLYDPQMRKSLFSLMSAYKDILVYFIFFSSVIVSYSFIGNQALTFDPNYKDPSFPQNVDPYKTNYDDLGHMIFMLYVTATFDSYPDNQTLVIQNYEPNYLYYIAFIFANMFLFSSIPGTLIYLKFRETRSRILLIDEIRQQHSLILAFVTLAENQSYLSIDKLIKFLLYLYKYKIRYVEYITDICLRLDDNNNRVIQVNQFMQLSKILLENSAMLPPTFQDIQLWVSFRKFMNKTFNLKVIVRHWIFELTVSIIIILSFINSIFQIRQATYLVIIFDQVFVWIFLAQLLMRIIAIGPQNFFYDRWNNVDTIMVILGLVFFFLPVKSIGVITKMGRIFRIATLLRLVSHSNFLKEYKFQIGEKIANIYSVLLQILPIIIRFMPFFVFFFYVYGIIGMEFFYNFYDTTGSPLYNQYQQFSNFASFIHSQYIMVMVLTQAGWSQVAFDHCWRAPNYYGFIMLFFCLLHITIVYIISTLIRGIFWQVFFTVNTIFQERNSLNEQQIKKEQSLYQKSFEIQDINEAIKDNQYIEPNTLIRRQVIQNKFDKEIFKKLKKSYDNEKQLMKNFKRSSLATRIIDEWQINLSQLKLSEDVRNKVQSRTEKSNQSSRSKIPINQIQQIAQEDLQSEMSQLLDKLLVNPKIKYNQMIISPKLFVDFLKSKFKNPEDLISESSFALHENPLYNQDSMYYHIYEIHALLEIETSKRQQKAMIVNTLIQQNIINQDQGQLLIRKKLQEKNFNIDTSGTLRRLFLSGTNEQLIKKFQIQYFSDLYGYSFKYINKITLQPLLKLQATLTYSLRNIMRYPQIHSTQFFEMMTHIEDKISNKLLQRGSLFKFVYKLDCDGDFWFSVEYKQHQQIKIHFIKSGIWCYYKDLKEKEIMYARDIFNWEFPTHITPETCQQYIKRFYHSFQGLAFSLLDQQKFFQGDPSEYVYDLYIQHFDVQKTMRYKTKRLEISKIMIVALSKEEERSEIGLKKLDYKLSDIKRSKPKHRVGQDFKIDQSGQETFEKLKHIAGDSEKIVDSQGLPFSYIVNLLKELSEILTISGQNFVYQIEKVLNDEYEEINEMNEEEENKEKEKAHYI